MDRHHLELEAGQTVADAGLVEAVLEAEELAVASAFASALADAAVVGQGLKEYLGVAQESMAGTWDLQGLEDLAFWAFVV